MQWPRTVYTQLSKITPNGDNKDTLQINFNTQNTNRGPGILLLQTKSTRG